MPGASTAGLGLFLLLIKPNPSHKPGMPPFPFGNIRRILCARSSKWISPKMWKYVCAKLLKMFLAAYPVSEHSYFSCRTTGRIAGWQNRRAGPKAEVLSLHRWLAKIFSNKFFKSFAISTLTKSSSHRHPYRFTCHFALSTGIPG